MESRFFKIVTLILFACTFSFALEPVDYVKAYRIMEKTGKCSLVIVGKEGCEFCKNLMSGIEKNRILKSYIQKHYVFSYIDFDKDFIPVEMIDVQAFPAIFIVKRNGEILGGPIYGVLSGQKLFSILKSFPSCY